MKGQSEIRKELAELGTRVGETEDSIISMSTRQDTQEDRMLHLEQLQTELLLKADDLENRSRRENLRLKGVKEKDEGSDMNAYLQRLFKAVLDDATITEVLLVRSHRVGPLIQTPNRRPRDILATFQSFQLKEQILRKMKGKTHFMFEGSSVQFYQDLTQLTLQKRREMQAVTAVLRDKQIRYKWGFPFRLIFQYEGSTRICTSVTEAREIVGLPAMEESNTNLNTPFTRGESARTVWRKHLGKQRSQRERHEGQNAEE